MCSDHEQCENLTRYQDRGRKSQLWWTTSEGTSERTAQVGLGINTCFAVKRWTQPDDILRIVRDDLDLDLCQLSVDNLPLADPTSAESRAYVRRFAAESKQAGVTLHSIFTGLAAYSTNLLLSDDAEARDAAERWYTALITLGGSVGVTSVGGHIGALSVPSAADPARRDSLLDELRERMLRLADRASAEGISTLLFENMAVEREPGSVRDDALELESSLSSASAPWQLCLDVGHPVAMEADGNRDSLGPWFAAPWRTPPMLQLQYSRPGADMHGDFDETDPEVGVSPRHVSAAIVDAGWEKSPMFIEVIPAHEKCDDAVVPELRRSVNAWTTVLA